MVMKYFKLASGDSIPALAYGSGTAWARSKKNDALYETLVDTQVYAVKAGFKHLDTAEFYNTYPEVGATLAKLKEDGIDRKDLWITDKFKCGFKPEQAPTTSGPYESLKLSLETMGTKYVDLYLLHSELVLIPGLTIKDYWNQMEKLKKEGLAKNIGVSNFSLGKLQELWEIANDKPEVLQIEYHAYLQSQTPGVVDFCKEKGILVEGYGPLNPITKAKGGPLDPVIEKLSAKYGKSDTVILLKWVHQTGVLPVTTTMKHERIDDIVKLFDFELDQEDVESITKVGKTHFYRGSVPWMFGVYDDNY